MYEDKTYSSLLQDALSDVGGGVQTGEGYLVYNALSALAYEMEKLYIQMDYITKARSCGHCRSRRIDRDCKRSWYLSEKRHPMRMFL